MARKKNRTTKRAEAKRVDILPVISSSDSYKSLAYGIATVIVLFIIGFGLTKIFINRGQKGEVDGGAVSTSKVKEALEVARMANSTPSATAMQATEVETPTPTLGITPTAPAQKRITEKTYKINEGDTLWDIAQKAYGDPYKWVQIAQANNLVNPDLIYAGDAITIPQN